MTKTLSLASSALNKVSSKTEKKAHFSEHSSNQRRSCLCDKNDNDARTSWGTYDSGYVSAELKIKEHHSSRLGTSAHFILVIVSVGEGILNELQNKKKSFFLSLVVIQLKRVTHVSRTLRHSCSNSNASWWRCYSKLDVIIKGVYETKIVHMWVPACNSVSAEPFKSSVNADPLEKELIYIWQAKIASSRYVR